MRISSECETALSDAEPRLLISSSDKRATQSRRSPRLQVGPTNAVYNPAFGAQQPFESGNREIGESGNRGNRRLLPTSSCTGSPRSVRHTSELAIFRGDCAWTEAGLLARGS
jgi:hypothetical protein